MNFGNNSHTGIVKQDPTYHLAPNFATRPYPDGPLQLGTVVEDIKQFWPLNQGDDRVPIPESERYSTPLNNVSASVSKSKNGEVGILARILDRSVGGDVSLRGQRNDNDVYTIEKLETIYFIPRKSYVSKCLQLPDVNDALEGSSFKAPVYLITGLKIAWGITISMEKGRQYDSSARIGVTDPTGTTNTQVEAKASAAGQASISTSFTTPADLVIGIQVLKIQHTKGIFSKERVMSSKLDKKGAVLVDDDGRMGEDGEAENNFIALDFDDEDLKGMAKIYESGADKSKTVVWIVPSDLRKD